MNANPLRKIAKEFGMGTRRQNATDLPRHSYDSVVKELNRLPRPGRRLSHEGGQMVAQALLTTAHVISCLTIVCVSLYQKKRWRLQGGEFVLTRGEREMFERAERLRDISMDAGVTMNWRLVLADAWSAHLFPEETDLKVNARYAQLIMGEGHRRGFSVVSWTELMTEHHQLWEKALLKARAIITDEMVVREADFGETRFDTHKDREHALRLARQHIEWRVAEAYVYTKLWGPQLGLSTESRALRRWDNLLVSRADYVWHDYMPKYPHWL